MNRVRFDDVMTRSKYFKIKQVSSLSVDFWLVDVVVWHEFLDQNLKQRPCVLLAKLATCVETLCRRDVLTRVSWGAHFAKITLRVWSKV